MPAVAAGAAVVGAGIAIYGAIKSADDQADLDRTRANIAQQQAGEIEQREQANEVLRDQQSFRQKLQFGSSYAASGKAGTGLGSQLQIQNQSDLQSMISNKEAKFQESMLNQQAGIDTTLAGQAESTGTLNAISAGLQGLGAGARLYTAGGGNPGYGGNQGLGPYPSSRGSGSSSGGLGAGAYGGG